MKRKINKTLANRLLYGTPGPEERKVLLEALEEEEFFKWEGEYPPIVHLKAARRTFLERLKYVAILYGDYNAALAKGTALIRERELSIELSEQLRPLIENNREAIDNFDKLITDPHNYDFTFRDSGVATALYNSLKALKAEIEAIERWRDEGGFSECMPEIYEKIIAATKEPITGVKPCYIRKGDSLSPLAILYQYEDIKVDDNEVRQIFDDIKFNYHKNIISASFEETKRRKNRPSSL